MKMNFSVWDKNRKKKKKVRQKQQTTVNTEAALKDVHIWKTKAFVYDTEKMD